MPSIFFFVSRFEFLLFAVYLSYTVCSSLFIHVTSAGLTIVANVAIATGPRALGAPRSSVINLIYDIIYKIIFCLRSQYFAKFAVSSKRDFQLNAVCVQKFLFDSFCRVSYATKRMRLRSALSPF